MLFRFKSTKRGKGGEMHKKNTKKRDSISLLLVSEELKDVIHWWTLMFHLFPT